ncbi:unnamed protein product [Lactuca virosa]|uniref:V-type proton ATPase subunit a n=1 Tax=Lactuca virosa TaxID=75947 RepID=A0AAU9P3U7_9ASTR|nr:unnamed protein product [Lactuca virosa]
MAEHGGGGGCCPPMDLFRSEPMHLIQVIIPIESARLTVSYLGDIGLIQFKDLNVEKSPFQRTYAGQIKRCAELARKLRFFKDQMSKADIIPSGKLDTKAGLNLDDLEVNLGDLEAELVEINANSEKLQRGYNELVEYKLVLQKVYLMPVLFPHLLATLLLFAFMVSNCFTGWRVFQSGSKQCCRQHGEGSSHQGAEESLETPLLTDQESTVDQGKQVKLGYITGLVAKEKAMAFERILFRATRGNVFLRQSSVDEAVTDPSSGEKVQKSVFVVFFSGERAKSKILKICEAFGANRYPFPEDLSKQTQMITEVSGRLSELKTTIDTGLVHRTNLLETIAKQYEQWNDLVRKERNLFITR